MRSRRCSTLSAPPPALLSNNPILVALIVVLLVGALLFALGTWLVRREAAAQIAQPAEVPEVETPEPSPELRIDEVERLAIVGQPWCIERLEREFLTDSDARIRYAAENALLVIRAR